MITAQEKIWLEGLKNFTQSTCWARAKSRGWELSKDTNRFTVKGYILRVKLLDPQNIAHSLYVYKDGSYGFCGGPYFSKEGKPI